MHVGFGRNVLSARVYLAGCENSIPVGVSMWIQVGFSRRRSVGPGAGKVPSWLHWFRVTSRGRFCDVGYSEMFFHKQ